MSRITNCTTFYRSMYPPAQGHHVEKVHDQLLLTWRPNENTKKCQMKIQMIPIQIELLKLKATACKRTQPVLGKLGAQMQMKIQIRKLKVKRRNEEKIVHPSLTRPLSDEQAGQEAVKQATNRLRER